MLKQIRRSKATKTEFSELIKKRVLRVNKKHRSPDGAAEALQAESRHAAKLQSNKTRSYTEQARCITADRNKVPILLKLKQITPAEALETEHRQQIRTAETDHTCCMLQLKNEFSEFSDSVFLQVGKKASTGDLKRITGSRSGARSGNTGKKSSVIFQK